MWQCSLRDLKPPAKKVGENSPDKKKKENK
jgi:hypothetical protein